MFSRIAASLQATRNPLYTLRDELAARGRPIHDLVSGNVTEHGIRFPAGALEAALREGLCRTSIYAPDSLGRLEARAAVGGYYAERGLALPPENILLTPGTSIAYWYAFKLLADPGDEILAPSPSYPLFDYIAALSGVRMIPYRMVEARGWQIDVEHLDACVSTRTRAIVLISPHNPTGHVASAAELRALEEVARRHDLALIADEVFGEFHAGTERPARPAAGGAPLVLTLNGFSKMFALPGLKLGWMGVSGEPERVREAMRALELISDTFLPVNEAVQGAVPRIFDSGREFLAGYAAEIRARAARIQGLLAQSRRLSWITPDGGFYLTLRLDGIAEDAAAEALLGAGLLAHPGHFYDAPADHLVLSFVQAPEIAAEAYPRLVETLERLATSG
jgi:aspartate/methionine/tyrosine aminotransferase